MYTNLDYEDKAKNLITNLLKAQEDGRVSSSCAYKHHIHTPFDLCEEICNKLPRNYGSKYLVLFNLEFVYTLREILDFEVGEVYYYTTDTNKAKLAEKLFPGVQILKGLDVNMKFDVVLGNPPYQNPNKGDAKRWVLWHQFVKNSIDMLRPGGLMGFIHPSSWCSPGEIFNIITKNQLIWLDTTAKKHFSVGSTFSAYVLKKTPTTDSTDVITENGNIRLDFSNINFLPKIINLTTLRINNKFFRYPVLDFRRTTEYHTSRKELFNDSGEFEVFHTNAQTLRTPHFHKNNTQHRVMISLSGYPGAVYKVNTGASQAVAWKAVQSAQEAQNLVTILNSRLFQYILEMNKWSGWNDLTVLRNLPALDLSSKWTDQELYDHFGLTQEEIDYIESGVK